MPDMLPRSVRRVLLALLVLCAACGGGSTAAPQAAPDGDFAVGETTITFVDTSRPTAPNGTYPGADSRTLKTTIYYPASGAAGAPVRSGAAPVVGKRFPLIVFAHGFTAVGKLYFVILQAWARTGYVVAAPDFPLSHGGAPGGAVSGDVINQPVDESFLIDEILRLTADRDSLLFGLVDATRIGASGQSLGGMTTFGIALNTCCRDARIGAAVPMAGSLIAYPDGVYDGAIGPPLLLIHGDADDTVPYDSGLEAYAVAAAPKALLTHLGGGHILPYVGSGDAEAVAATIDASTAWFDLYLKHERGALDRLLALRQSTRVRLETDLAAR
ncbi:MAG: phospholipase [bacterium]